MGSRTQNCVVSMRRHNRWPSKGPVQVSWKDGRGKVKSLWAKCLDLSAEGVCLETNGPIPPRTAVNLHSAQYGDFGTASVRHCARMGVKYSVGLEFTSALALASPGRKRSMADAQRPTTG